MRTLLNFSIFFIMSFSESDASNASASYEFESEGNYDREVGGSEEIEAC